MRLLKTTRRREERGVLPQEEPLLYPYANGDWLLDLSPVLVLAPHPDDETFGCGGILLLMSKKGCSITLIAVSDGSKGTRPEGLSVEEYVDLRKREFERVSRTLGASYAWWGFEDRSLTARHRDVAKKVEEALNQLKPRAVFAPSPWEIHPDHRLVTEILVETLKGKDTLVVFYEGVVPLRPNLMVDISEVKGEKMRLMEIYESQLNSLPYHRSIAGLNLHRSLTLPRCDAAEAFVVLSPQKAESLLGLVRKTEGLLLPAHP